jgi:hypothetical protein
MRNRLILTVPALLVVTTLWSQETLLDVPFSQPLKLKVDAGDDRELQSGTTLVLGNDLTIQGGTPDFLYGWTDPDDIVYHSPTVTVTLPGTYYLTVTDAENCTDRDSVNVSAATFIPDESESSAIFVFPNPTAGVVHFQLTDAENPVRIEIITDEGRIILTGLYDPVRPLLSGTLDLTGIDRGIYYVRVMTGTKKYVKPIIIR